MRQVGNPQVGQDHARTRTRWLPAGHWTGYWTGRHHHVRRWVTVPAPLSQIPMPTRGGHRSPLPPAGRMRELL
ncbi:hypothetical protein [Pseudonocardia humida]|uniref:hypothetical protein n=1 Tax=Pseudonocardia humida TaxID=2800819 RepID=UPI0035560F11